MSIFPNIKNETIVQVNDKTRIDCTSSFISKDEDAITKVEIKPTTTGDFIDVTGSSSSDWYLDWSYSTENTDGETITCRITTTTLPAPVTSTSTSTIIVYSAATDKLLSTDQDIVRHEPDILKYIPAGRNSYKNIHRLAQDLILQWLDKNGYTDINGDKFTKDAMLMISEFTAWSKFMVLRLIHEGLSNAIDDIFHVKAKRYLSMEIDARQRVILRLDVDGSGAIDTFENIITTGRIFQS